MLDNVCTIFQNIKSKEPKYITVRQALDRIKTGRSKDRLQAVKNATTKDEANEAKTHLPSVCFSGKFGKDRKDDQLQIHSNGVILDFDNVENVEGKKNEVFKNEFVVASWVSPSGKGVKALVCIAEGKKHREHFDALRDVFPEIDKSGVNEARVCYESHDPAILIREDYVPFAKYKITTYEKQEVKAPTGNEVFQKLVKWMSNKRESFIEGNRNRFIYILAGACCRYGMAQSECESNMNFAFVSGSGITDQEMIRTIRSAYNGNRGNANTAYFSNDILVEKKTTKEVEIDASVYDKDVRPKDVFYGKDVKQEALNIFLNGYESATPLYMGSMDKAFKWKKGEITCLTGIGNMGKSSLLKQLLLLQVICEGAKVGIFAPEDFPAHEYYHELTEMYIGAYCTPTSYNKPTQAYYEAVYDFISEHFFFVYPQSGTTPTPEYIKERFLELIIKESITFCVIDPFNQLFRDAGVTVDYFLEVVLADLTRFARENNQHFVIIAHPNGTGLAKSEDGNFKRPDVNNIAGGTMWNNKMDNVLVYHRPFSKTEPDNPACEFESAKIRRQKVVGKKMVIHFERDNRTQRYTVDNIDWVQHHIDRITKTSKHVTQSGDLVDTETGEVLNTSEECPF